MRTFRLFQLLSLSLLAGCAPRQVLPVLPQGNYRYAGAVGGQPVSGLVDLGEYVTVNDKSEGYCRTLESMKDLYLRGGRGRRMPVGCGMNLELEWDSHGQLRPIAHVSAVRVREEVRRGECLAWNEVDGRRVSCAAYAQKIVKITTTERGTVTIEPAQ